MLNKHARRPPLRAAQDTCQAVVEQWVDWANSFDAPGTQCLYPILGMGYG